MDIKLIDPEMNAAKRSKTGTLISLITAVLVGKDCFVREQICTELIKENNWEHIVYNYSMYGMLK